MIKPLRRRHRQIWIAWALLLPTGILFAWLAIPSQAPVQLLQRTTAALLPVVVRSADQQDYLVKLRSNQDRTVWQLEWSNKAALALPTAVIYNTGPERVDSTAQFQPQKAELIGRIETKQDYVFPLRNDSTGYEQLNLVLYDFIHEKVITIIHL